MFNPFSKCTELSQNQAIPSAEKMTKRKARVPYRPFRKGFFFSALTDLLQQQQKEIPMIRLFQGFIKLITKLFSTHLSKAKIIPKATQTTIGVFCLSMSR